MKEPVTLVMSFFCFSKPPQTALADSCFFASVTSNAKNMTGIKSSVKGFAPANCLSCKSGFFTCSTLTINSILTHKIWSDAASPSNYRGISPALICGNDENAENPGVAISSSYLQPNQSRNKELFFQLEFTKNFRISPEYSISSKKWADVKTSCSYSVTEKVPGYFQPVKTLSCLLNTRKRFISTTSGSHSRGKKFAAGNDFPSTISGGQFNSLSFCGAFPLDDSSIVEKNLIGTKKEAGSSAGGRGAKESST